jgi:hypothetical protein
VLVSHGFDGGRRGGISGRRLVICTGNRASVAEDNQIRARRLMVRVIAHKVTPN